MPAWSREWWEWRCAVCSVLHTAETSTCQQQKKKDCSMVFAYKWKHRKWALRSFEVLPWLKQAWFTSRGKHYFLSDLLLPSWWEAMHMKADEVWFYHETTDTKRIYPRSNHCRQCKWLLIVYIQQSIHKYILIVHSSLLYSSILLDYSLNEYSFRDWVIYPNIKQIFIIILRRGKKGVSWRCI